MEEKNDLMGNITNDNNKMKKYLIVGGLVFVIFVIGIVIAKFVFGASKDNTQVILPPEPTTKTQKADTELFSSIPVEKSDKTDNIKVNPEKKVSQPKQEKNITEFKKPEPTKIEDVNIETKKNTTKEFKPKQKKQNISIKTVKNYYIQVAAVTRGEPSKRFLKLIRKSGFKYKIMTFKIKGKNIKRVLVGPFTEKEARKELSKVKAKITASAFIKKLK
jgi:cell division septation protein DedD